MTSPASGVTALQFQAPPTLPDVVEDHDGPDGFDQSGERGGRSPRRAGGPQQARDSHGEGTAALRMLKGARAAATGMNISDAQIRAVLDEPEGVEPDPTQPRRTRLSRDGITITVGNDGMILRVTRRR